MRAEIPRPDRAPSSEWSTETKVKIAVGAVVVVGGLYLLARASTGGVPTPAELRFLLSSANQFGLKHVEILRRLAVSTGYNVASMMGIIEAPAMEVAALEVATQFPPAFLPANTTYSIVANYIDPTGQAVTSTINMYSSYGAQAWQAARAETIREFTAANILPVLKSMFTDFVGYAKSGLTDFQILNIMTGPAPVPLSLPHAAAPVLAAF